MFTNWYGSRCARSGAAKVIIALSLAANAHGNGHPAAAGQPCDVITQELTLDFEHTGTSSATIEFDFCSPVALDDVSFITLDTVVAEITTTSSVLHSYALVAELLSDGQPVVALSSMTGSQSGTFTTKRNFPPRVDGDIPGDVTVDGLRITSAVSDTSMSVRYTGAYSDNAVRVRIARGSIGSGSCHNVAIVPAALPVVVVGAGSSDWITQMFDSPIPATDLHFALVQHPGYSISNATIDSFDIEGQLLLDNGDMLQMDNWSTPGASGPPSEMRVWGCAVRLAIGYPACAALGRREITGWRWRVHKTGDGLLTVTQIDPTKIWFLRHPCGPKGDVNLDGDIDGIDLATMLAEWGPCDTANDCTADVTGDCVVDGSDVAVLLGQWSEPDIAGDLTGDGLVDGSDLAILLGDWGACGACDDCPADLDDDCAVNGADLAILLGGWG